MIPQPKPDNNSQAFIMIKAYNIRKMEITEKAGTEKPRRRVQWLKLVLTFLVMIALSFGLVYLFQNLISRFNLPIYKYAWLAYLLIFGISLIANLSVLVPVPFAASIMVAAATTWNPLLVAFFGSLGGSLGELSGYYAGYLGTKLAIPESTMGFKLIERWLQRYGVWAISLLALQPILPFDIGGFIAGAGKMPIRKFLPALWLGKFPKYIFLIYVGIGLINFLPSWLK